VTPETDTGRPEAVDESVAVQPRPRLSRVRRDSRDQCREEFLAFVEELLDAIEAEPLEGERDAALELAADLWSRGDRPDSDICELIVRKLLGSESLREFVATGNY